MCCRFLVSTRDTRDMNSDIFTCAYICISTCSIKCIFPHMSAHTCNTYTGSEKPHLSRQKKTEGFRATFRAGLIYMTILSCIFRSFVGRYDYVALQYKWHIPVCMYIHMYIHVCILCNAYTCVCVRMRACVRADVRACVQMSVRACNARVKCMYTFSVHHLCLISHQSHQILCLKAIWQSHCIMSAFWSVGKKGQDVCRVKQCLYLLHLFRRSSSKRSSILIFYLCCAYNGCILLEFHYAGNSHICIYMYKFIYISIYINEYISIWVNLCTWIHLYVYIYIHN